MGPVVLDASAVAGAFFKDEDPTFAAAVLRYTAQQGGYVPSLFWYEVRNVLLVGERRKRITAAQSDEALTTLRLAGFRQAQEASDREVFALSRKHGLSAYDAAYAALAIGEQVPLATLDKKLIAAGEAGAFALWQPPDHKDGGGDDG